MTTQTHTLSIEDLSSVGVGVVAMLVAQRVFFSIVMVIAGAQPFGVRALVDLDAAPQFGPGGIWATSLLTGLAGGAVGGFVSTWMEGDPSAGRRLAWLVFIVGCLTALLALAADRPELAGALVQGAIARAIGSALITRLLFAG